MYERPYSRPSDMQQFLALGFTFAEKVAETPWLLFGARVYGSDIITMQTLVRRHRFTSQQ